VRRRQEEPASVRQAVDRLDRQPTVAVAGRGAASTGASSRSRPYWTTSDVVALALVPPLVHVTVTGQLPGVVAAGTFYDGRWWFLDVHRPEVAVKIDLDHEHYAALIVEVADPVATVAAINAAIAALPSSGPAR
jgi:hypothetical protein